MHSLYIQVVLNFFALVAECTLWSECGSSAHPSSFPLYVFSTIRLVCSTRVGLSEELCDIKTLACTVVTYVGPLPALCMLWSSQSLWVSSFPGFMASGPLIKEAKRKSKWNLTTVHGLRCMKLFDVMAGLVCCQERKHCLESQRTLWYVCMYSNI